MSKSKIGKCRRHGEHRTALVLGAAQEESHPRQNSQSFASNQSVAGWPVARRDRVGIFEASRPAATLESGVGARDESA